MGGGARVERGGPLLTGRLLGGTFPQMFSPHGARQPRWRAPRKGFAHVLSVCRGLVSEPQARGDRLRSLSGAAEREAGLLPFFLLREERRVDTHLDAAVTCQVGLGLGPRSWRFGNLEGGRDLSASSICSLLGGGGGLAQLKREEKEFMLCIAVEEKGGT